MRVATMVLIIGMVLPAASFAQQQGVQQTRLLERVDLPPLTRERPAPAAAQAKTRKGLQWGSAIGAASGAAAAAVAAERYGQNEGGRFCTACFAQWSLISVPIGIAIGAVAGALIDVARQ